MTTTTLTRIKTIFDVRPLPVSSNLIDKTLHTDHRGGAPFLEGGISIGVIVEFLDRPDEGRRRPFWWRAPCVIVRSAGAGAGEKADDRPGTTKAPGWSGGSSGDPLGSLIVRARYGATIVASVSVQTSSIYRGGIDIRAPVDREAVEGVRYQL